MGLIQDIKLLIEHSRIVNNTVVRNWNSGVATSGLPGGDLFTYGVANQWWRMAEAYLVLAAFNVAATVTIRAYLNLAGAPRMIMDDDWVVAVDGDLAYIIWFWDVEVFGPLRIEVFSDQAADDGLAAPYEYRVKRW